MNLRVDDAGQDVKACTINGLASLISGKIADTSDFITVYSYIPLTYTIMIDNGAIFENQIESCGHEPRASLQVGSGIRKSMAQHNRTPIVMNKIAELTDRAVLKVAGEDAESFLQNVVTSDVTGLGEGKATYAALLTPQGKLLFDFFVVKAGEAYLIDCSAAQRPQLLQRLTMYKLRAKVTITADDDVNIYAAWGDEAPGMDMIYADPRTPEMGWRIIGTTQTNADASEYLAHRVGLGIADTEADIGSGEIFPHEGNLDQLGGVSFSKGCFVGQEVVSRMEHRGTARTRFVIARSQAGLDSEAEVKAGDLRIGAIKSVNGNEGLALIRLDRAGSAISKGTPITVDGEPIEVRAPAWAKFEIPVPAEDAK